MLDIEKEHLENIPVEQLMIPAEKVAHVQIGNPLEHALLVLVKSGYSAVPVLDPSFRFKGVISKSRILEETMGIERFELERLEETQVFQVMESDVPCLNRGDFFIDALHKLIDYPFVCVTNEDGEFDGIVTRRTILKHISKYYHEHLKHSKTV